jgi:plasmid stabilization system protein ParE
LSYRLSKRAVQDVEDILAYTLASWGRAQVEVYASEFHRVFEFLAGLPMAGRPFGANREFVHTPYIVVYRQTPAGILIGRILHGARRR